MQLTNIVYSFFRTLRTLLGPAGCCQFTITCMQYARIELREQPLHIAVWNICKRLLACNPLRR